MLEVARRLGVEPFDLLHAQLAEQLGQDDAAHGVDRVDSHLEMSLADGFHINEFEGFDGIDVTLVEAVVLLVMA